MPLDYRFDKSALPFSGGGIERERFYAGALNNMLIDPSEPNAVNSNTLTGYSDMNGFEWQNWRVGERKPTRMAHLNYWNLGPRAIGFYILNVFSGSPTCRVRFVVDGLDQFGIEREEEVIITQPTFVGAAAQAAAFYNPGAAALPFRTDKNVRIIVGGNLQNFGEFPMSSASRTKYAWSQPCGITLLEKTGVGATDQVFPNMKTLVFGIRSKITSLRDILHASIHKPYASSGLWGSGNVESNGNVWRTVNTIRNTTPIEIKVDGLGGVEPHRTFDAGGS